MHGEGDLMLPLRCRSLRRYKSVLIFHKLPLNVPCEVPLIIIVFGRLVSWPPHGDTVDLSLLEDQFPEDKELLS